MNNSVPQRKRVDSEVSRSNSERGTERPIQRRGHPRGQERNQEESVLSKDTGRPAQDERRARSQEPNQGTPTRRPVQRRGHQGTNNQNTGTAVISRSNTKKVISKKKKRVSYETLFYISLVVYGISFFLGVFYFTNYTKSVDDYNALQESVSSLREDNEVYISDIDRLMSKIDENKEYISTLESSLESAADELGQVDSLKKNNKKYKKKIDSYKKKVESYKSRVSELETTLAAIPTPTPEPEVPFEYEQAVAEGQSYLDYTSFSRQGLYDQLLYEGYPADAAQYAVDILFG